MSNAERTRPFGQPLPRTRKERLLANCQERDCGFETPCWIWVRRVDRDGYPQFRFAKGEREQRAHRHAYEMFVGPIPAGLHVHHRCSNRACINPDHLEAVTCRENLMLGDTYAARAAAQTHCIHGHPFDEENTYRYTDGSRHCRACARRRRREYLHRQKAARKVAA